MFRVLQMRNFSILQLIWYVGQLSHQWSLWKAKNTTKAPASNAGISMIPYTLCLENRDKQSWSSTKWTYRPVPIPPEVPYIERNKVDYSSHIRPQSIH